MNRDQQNEEPRDGHIVIPIDRRDEIIRKLELAWEHALVELLAEDQAA